MNCDSESSSEVNMLALVKELSWKFCYAFIVLATSSASTELPHQLFKNAQLIEFSVC